MKTHNVEHTVRISDNPLFSGTLQECEAWIKQNGTTEECVISEDLDDTRPLPVSDLDERWPDLVSTGSLEVPGVLGHTHPSGQEVWLGAIAQGAADNSLSTQAIITYADAILAAYRERFPK